jgi:hypothetical protein
MAESFVANDDYNIEYLVEYVLSEDRVIRDHTKSMSSLWVGSGNDWMDMHAILGIGKQPLPYLMFISLLWINF